MDYIPRLAPIAVYATNSPGTVFTQRPLERLLTELRFDSNAYSFDVQAKTSSLTFSEGMTTTDITAVFKKPIKEDILVTDEAEIAPPLIDYLTRKLALEICNMEGAEPMDTLVASIREAANRFANQKMSQNKIITMDFFPRLDINNGFGI